MNKIGKLMEGLEYDYNKKQKGRVDPMEHDKMIIPKKVKKNNGWLNRRRKRNSS